MSENAYSLALKNALTEIRNVCPDVQTSFLLDNKATLIAGDAETPEAALERVVGSLEGILEKTDTIGGLDSLVIEGSKGNVHISSVSDMYLTMITSKKVDMKYLETVARVLIPTVIKLLDSLGPTPINELNPDNISLEPKRKKELKELLEDEELIEEDMDTDNEDEEDEEFSVSDVEIPSNQLIVESFGGLLVRSDTVQISEDIMNQWEELMNSKGINHVEIESFNGKTSQCKVKTLDGSKMDNKAIIRIPDKLCQTLHIKKGELVKVTPVNPKGDD